MKMLDDQISKWETVDVPRTKEKDFDLFWQQALEKVAAKDLNISGGPIDYPYPNLDIRDITFEGLDGTPVRTWLILPPEAKSTKVPAVVFYHGAGGSRPEPSWATQWTSMGCAVIAHDFRLQQGDTGSNSGFNLGKSYGLFSMGLEDKYDFYFYHAITDALLAVKLAKNTPEIDPARICVSGGSQGGATSLSVASLDNDVSLCLADVPSNCWFEKRLFDEAGGVADLANFLKTRPEKIDEVLKIFSYYDNINLVEKIKCPTLMSLGMKDPVCPPENVYAAYNKITAPKEIVCYPFAKHEGGGSKHTLKQLQFVKKYFFDN